MIIPTGQDYAGIYYYHYDALGNVVALSNTDGEVEEDYSYDVYGKPDAASSIGNPYLFTGRRYDSESTLYYYRARYYSYSLGRFLQPDPIGYDDGMNMYGYCGNSPLVFADPMGLCKGDKRNAVEKWMDIWYNVGCHWDDDEGSPVEKWNDNLHAIGYNWDDMDAVTVSISGAWFDELIYGGGAGGGIEAVYIFNKGWVIYGQTGVGSGSPGGGASVEIGPVYNVDEPSDYTGLFIEGQLGVAPGSVGLSISGFYEPGPAGLYPAMGGSWGYKGGLYVGTHFSGGTLLEKYYIVHDFTD